MSSSSRFVKSSAFDVSSITYGKPVMDSRGGKKIPINYGSGKLSLQTPLMFTWGMNERVSEDTGRISYDINPVFQSSKSDNIATFSGENSGTSRIRFLMMLLLIPSSGLVRVR